MTYVLTNRQRAALKELTKNKDKFTPYWQFLRAGKVSLNLLVEVGLAETGPTNRRRGEIGWRITENGWRCIYGKTYTEIIAPGALPPYPLKIWSWPPSRP
jgi:hypothetical protein